MPSTSLIYHSLTPVSTYLTFHNLTNCIMLLTHIEIVPYPGIFMQNAQSWDKGIFCLFLGPSGFFSKTFLTLLVFLPTADVLIYVLVSETHYILSAFSMQCCHM